MSKTLYIEFHGRGFWAFDVITSVLLKHLIDAAAPRAAALPWLGEVIQRWREDAIISDFGFFLDEDWSDEQVAAFCDLTNTACETLKRRDGISAQEIENWQILDDNRIFARGIPVVPTKPIIRLAEAIVALVKGTLPKPPLGHYWFFTTEDHPQAIRMNPLFTLAILEDNHERQQAMKAAVDEALPNSVCHFFDSANGMIDWLKDWLACKVVRPPALISLDHDLDFLRGSDGKQIDPGDGRDVASFLSTRQPFCPVIVHTSNSLGASSMTANLEAAGWQVTRVYPESELGWVKSEWIAAVFRLCYEWWEAHKPMAKR